MTNKTDEQILADAPDGATHYSWETYCKANKDFFYDWDGEYWCAYFVPDGDMRSLADIKELVELRKENAELEEELELMRNRVRDTFDYCESVKKSLPIRDLEQQAKGLEDYANNQSGGMLATWMIAQAEKLREQAKQLKERTK